MANPFDQFDTPDVQAAPAPAAPPPVAAAAPQPEPKGFDWGQLAEYAAGLTPQGIAGQLSGLFTDPTPDAQYILQRGDRGLADAVGAPVDLIAGGLNLLGFGADKVAQHFGGSMPARVREPVMGSDWIANIASEINKLLGGTEVDPNSVGPMTRLAGAGARGAASTMVPAFALAGKAGQGGQMVEKLAEPYINNTGATLARDAAAGAGSGVAAQSYDDFAPQGLKDSFAGPFVKMAASLLGGAGTMIPAAIAEGAVKGVSNAVRNAIHGAGDPNAPVNPSTGKPFTRSEMDMGARVAQEMPSNRSNAISNIEDNAADFGTFAKPKEMPTVGMLADDPGMALQENILRTRDAKRFAEADAARRSRASSAVDASAPANADSRAFTGEAERQYDQTLGSARQNVENAVSAQDAAKQDIARQNVELEAARANQPRASEALASEFDAARRAGRQAKNAAYDAVDPATPVENGNDLLKGALDNIDGQMSNAERLAGGSYADISSRIRQLVDSGEPITYGDVKALKAQISEAKSVAIGLSGQSAAGSGADVQRLNDLGQVVGYMADQVNPEAAKHYAEKYAPKFKTGKAGEYGAAMDRAARTGGESSATRPSDFGQKFLTKPEDAASLKRALTPEQEDRLKQLEVLNGLPKPTSEGSQAAPTSGLFPQSEQNIRDWMLGDLAKSGVLTDNAEIRFDRFKQWADKNRATIDQFPSLAEEVNAELAKAQRGGMLSKQLASEVAAAREGLKGAEQDLRRSALQHAIGNNPENAVAGIMGSGDPEKQMADMVKRLQGNQEATDGLKAATRDWIKREAGVTSKIVGDPDAVRLSRAKLDKLFQQHETTLAKIYSPDEMNALRQAQKLMGAEAKLDVRTTAGSNTVDKVFAAQNASNAQKTRMLEAALKAKFGVLKGGGVFRTMTLFLSALPDGRKALDDLLFEMQFNPDLAKHLLTRPVEQVGTPSWNSKLNQLMSVATGARESVEKK